MSSVEAVRRAKEVRLDLEESFGVPSPPDGSLPDRWTFVRHWQSQTDIGIIRDSNEIFWHDGHIDMVHQHTFSLHPLGGLVSIDAHIEEVKRKWNIETETHKLRRRLGFFSPSNSWGRHVAIVPLSEVRHRGFFRDGHFHGYRRVQVSRLEKGLSFAERARFVYKWAVSTPPKFFEFYIDWQAHDASVCLVG